MQTVLLTEAAFEKAFSSLMRNVTAEFAPEPDFWSYVGAIPVPDLEGVEVVVDKIDYVYGAPDNSFQHVLVATSVRNVHLVIVVQTPGGVLGHHLLDLNEKYGLTQAPSAQVAAMATAVCEQHGVVPQPPPKWSKVGIALATLELDPLSGVRLSPEGSTSGWFIWGGVRSSDSPDFFQPLHIAHLAERCPRVLRLLSLPPGWRFLLGANDYEDAWRDDTIIEP